MDIVRLKEKLEEIPDPRRPWGNIRHNLTDILVIGLATLLCNGSDYGDMELFAEEREAELKKFLELPNGIPGESTFFRALLCKLLYFCSYGIHIIICMPYCL